MLAQFLNFQKAKFNLNFQYFQIGKLRKCKYNQKLIMDNFLVKIFEVIGTYSYARDLGCIFLNMLFGPCPKTIFISMKLVFRVS